MSDGTTQRSTEEDNKAQMADEMHRTVRNSTGYTVIYAFVAMIAAVVMGQMVVEVIRCVLEGVPWSIFAMVGVLSLLVVISCIRQAVHTARKGADVDRARNALLYGPAADQPRHDSN